MSYGRTGRALERAEALLLRLPSIESLLARRLIDGADAVPDELLDELAEVLCGGREPDGSWQGSVCRTAEHLLLLSELGGTAPLHALASPSVEWLRQRLLRPVPPDRGCTPELHRLRLCTHGTSVFAAVSTASGSLAGLRLLTGAGFTSDFDARVGAAALATAALVRWTGSTADLDEALSPLVRIVDLEPQERSATVSSDSLACIALALLAATGADHAGSRSALRRGVAALARAQRGDGSWVSGELFFILSVLTDAAREPECAEPATQQLRRTAELLTLMQQPDGSWSRRTGAWPLYVGWRALRAVSRRAEDLSPVSGGA